MASLFQIEVWEINRRVCVRKPIVFKANGPHLAATSFYLKKKIMFQNSLKLEI